MAKRKFDLVVIDDVNYQKRKCHVTENNERVSIGFVPVREFTTPKAFREFIDERSDGDLLIDIDNWQYGEGVRLQGMARNLADPSSNKMTQADHDRIGDSFTAEEMAAFAHKHSEMEKTIRARWELEQRDKPKGLDKYKDYVWVELVQ